MTEQSATHATFTLERRYESAPGRVFAAFADPEQKRRWFVAGEGLTVYEYTMDFRIGGLERTRFRFEDGPALTNEAVFMDIVDNERIVVACRMTAAGLPISAALATIEFKSEGNGTRLVLTEQRAFLDGIRRSSATAVGAGWSGHSPEHDAKCAAARP